MATSARFSVDQRHDVSDRADGHDVREPAQRQRQFDQLVRRLLEQRVGELEGDAHTGEMRAGIAGQLGCDHDALGQRSFDLVMVGDDDVHAERARQRDFVPRADAAVHGDEQLDAGGGEFLHRRRRDAVALGEAVGQP